MANPLHIGIAACSAEGAALCYKTICEEASAFLGEHAHPEVTMHTPSLAEYNVCINSGDWSGVGEIMLSSAGKLAAVGADFVICPDNTIHQAFSCFIENSPIPWLHIADVVAAYAVTQGYKKVGLTGTRWLIDSSVYPESLSKHGIECVRPPHVMRETMGKLIMDELVKGVFKESTVRFFQQAIDQLKSEGCDAAILGCTEIPLIISDKTASLPTLDSTRLLARAAIQRSINCMSAENS